MFNLLSNIYIFLAETADKAPDPNNELFGKIAIGIAVGVFFLPIFVLTMIVCIRSIIRAVKKSRLNVKESNTVSKENEYLAYFGENDNILSIKKQMTRVSVEVKDLEQVNLDGLKDLQIGVLIVGNTVKCSSKELSESLEER